MSYLVKLSIQFKEKVFNVDINSKGTIVDLKKLVFLETGLEPNRQKFSNLELSESIRDEEYEMGNLNIEPNFILIIEDKFEKPPSPSRPFGDVPEKAILPFEEMTKAEGSSEFQSSSSKSGGGDEKAQETTASKKEYIFHVFNEPRDDKKLAVLDIDKTIYDIDGGTRIRPHGVALLAERPFLQEFLEEIYEDYDICVWSSTQLNYILAKLNVLSMIDNPNYKICFCLDVKAIRKTKLGPCTLQSKPLEIIWKKYTQFNCRNTVIIDDRLTNFKDNPRNGIQVTKYTWTKCSTDRELLYLKSYLKLIAKSDDVTAFNHRKWKQLLDAHKIESTDEDAKRCEFGESINKGAENA